MHKGFLKTAAWLGALSVAMGAFGAHKLRDLLSEKQLSIFETGVRYQFYHVFGLALVAILWASYPNKLMKAAGQLFLIGTVFFSGSLYLITYLAATGTGGIKLVGPITPIGGLLYIIGWICLALGVKTNK